MNYIEEITKLCRVNINKASNSGFGMFNFNIKFGGIFRNKSYDDDVTIFQVYPFEGSEYYGDMWVLLYYKDKKTHEYENDVFKFSDLTNDEKMRLYSVLLEQIGDKNITYEYCPHCEKTVPLVAELNVQICPECGKHIVVCSCCTALDDNLSNCCINCCLSHLADGLNREYRIMNTSNGHNEKLVELINKAWNEEGSDRFKPILKALYYRDYDECVEKGVFGENEDIWLEDWDYKACAYEYLMYVADDNDLATILMFLKVSVVDYVIDD